MKARGLHDFFIFVQKFTLKSMIKAVSFWSCDIYRNPDKKMGSFLGERTCNSIKKPIQLMQTYLIDLVYDLIRHNIYGKSDILKDEALKLIGLYGDYKNFIDGKNIYKYDFFLYLYGFFGEQLRFQNKYFSEEFAREKYILEKISKYSDAECHHIDVEEEFKQETYFSTDVYSANIFLVFIMFNNTFKSVDKKTIYRFFENTRISHEDIIQIIEANAISIEDIRKHPLCRQVLYTKPIIKINDEYVASNPFLILSLFSNSNYWVLRNRYLKKNSQNFVNAFGFYFEKYVEELFCRCLHKDDYVKILTSQKEKRADWKLCLDGFDILVEQKSSMPVLGIKQNQPNLKEIKKHIIKVWGEAVEQLLCTEKHFSLKESIKIILVYDEYFKSEAIEELFKLRNDLKNDGNYWLINIREFEMLIMLYYKDRAIFKKVMEEKIELEKVFSHSGRELCFFLEKYNIIRNDYLREFGILYEYDKIKKYYIEENI